MTNQERPPESSDDIAVRLALERLETEPQSVLDDAGARLFASQLHTGQYSHLYSLASTGAIHEELPDELQRDAAGQGVSERMTRMYDAIGSYAADRGVRGPVAGWIDEAPTEPIRTAEQLRAEAWYAWVGHVGSDNTDAAAETFEAHYINYFTSREAFARDLLTSQGAYQTLDELHSVLPERVNRFLSFDEEAYIDSLDDEYYFAPADEVGVHVFIDVE